MSTVHLKVEKFLLYVYIHSYKHRAFRFEILDDLLVLALLCEVKCRQPVSMEPT